MTTSSIHNGKMCTYIMNSGLIFMVKCIFIFMGRCIYIYCLFAHVVKKQQKQNKKKESQYNDLHPVNEVLHH